LTKAGFDSSSISFKKLPMEHPIHQLYKKYQSVNKKIKIIDTNDEIKNDTVTVESHNDKTIITKEIKNVLIRYSNQHNLNSAYNLTYSNCPVYF
jgi:hypothetical protein